MFELRVTNYCMLLLQLPRTVNNARSRFCGLILGRLVIFFSQVKTPTLIMLGSDDMRVPPSQGKSFYRALKAQGTEAR